LRGDGNHAQTVSGESENWMDCRTRDAVRLDPAPNCDLAVAQQTNSKLVRHVAPL
jgi:hypothetical protein